MHSLSFDNTVSTSHILFMSLCSLHRADLVNTALVNHFINDLEIKNHFILLKRYLLLEDGEFANVLSSKLFHQVDRQYIIYN